MATPTTVLEFATNSRNAAAAARTAAQTQLSTAQTALASARAQLASASAAVAEKEKSIAAKRTEVSQADTPAEGATLIVELAALIAESRTLQSELLAAKDAVAEAAFGAEAATSALTRATSGLATAETELVAATNEDERRSALAVIATAPPLDTIADAATDALAAEPYTTARDLVEDVIPDKLIAAARKSYEMEAARGRRLQLSRQNAENLLIAELAQDDGAAGLVQRRRIELDRAEAALREWSDQAQDRLTRAIAMLDAIAAGGPLLNPIEADAIEELDDTPAQEAVDARLLMLDAQVVQQDAQLDLDEARSAARADDPTADVAAVPAVVTAQTAVTAANTDLNTKRGAYEAVADEFIAWSAEVPDSAWRKILTFVEADAILNALEDTDAADVTVLIDAVEAAEEALAAALDARHRHATTVAFLEDFVNLRDDRASRSGATDPARLLSAARGDA